jgi:hypothetical protein
VELRALCKQLDKDLAQGFIEPSTSPAAAPILFIKKKNGELRMCVDYRGLNAITIKNRYSLPLTTELLDRLRRARYFTQLDLQTAYNLVCIMRGEEWKTAFRCRYGHFQFRVMPFGLTNASGTFQALINDTLVSYLDEFAVALLDDIIVYSNTLEEHTAQVQKVLERLAQSDLFVQLDKCEFHKPETAFLEYIVGREGIRMDPEKVTTITNWPTSRSRRELESFLDFANFYQRFIQAYSRIA